MATTEPAISPPATSGEVGRHLRTVRKAKGLSRAEVARSAGLTRRELAAYERGRTPVPDSDLWCLAGSCGVDVSDLLPSRDKLNVGGDLGSLTVGDSVRRLRAGAGNDGLLREYLAMIYELRNLPPGTRPPMREEDLAALAEALGGKPEAIESRLAELIGASRDEAARLRVMILPPRALPPAPATPVPAMSEFGDLNQYGTAPVGAPAPMPASPMPTSPIPLFTYAPAPEPGPSEYDFAMTANTTVGDPEATARFFDAPRADDPFSAALPMEALAPLDMTATPPRGVDALPMLSPTIEALPEPFEAPDPEAVASAPSGTFDPFAPPDASPIDPFASPPSGPPLGAVTAPASVDPFNPPAAFETSPFDPASFDRASFDPGAFAATPPVDPLGVDTPAGDPFGVEVVALGPDDALSASANAYPAAASTEPSGEEDWMATWESLDHVSRGETPLSGLTDPLAADDDDPWAVLRMPVEGMVVDDGADAVAAVETHEVLDAPIADEPADPFADAFEPVAFETIAEAPGEATVEAPSVETVGFDDEPADDWFDRAAAATAALIADHQAGTGDDVTTETEAFIPDALGTEELLTAELGTEARVDDDQVDETDETDDALIAAPVAGLAPIAWSLHPPTPEPSTDDDAASTDEVEEFVAVSDTEFVTAGPDWQVGGIFPATAMADDGTLALRRADVRWALADLVANDDFAVRATVDFTSGAGFGILFRVSTDDSERITGYSFDVDPIYSGGGFLLRQWHDSRQHWKPLAHAPVADSTRLYGHHTIEVTLRADQFTAGVDGETVLTIRRLSRCSIESGREPCRGGRLGVQAWSTTEVTVDRLMLANF